jgi:hypothetical protein
VVRKEYYPVDCMKGMGVNSSLRIKEAQAYLNKRAEMYSESLDLFLYLIEQLTYENIELEVFSGK